MPKIGLSLALRWRSTIKLVVSLAALLIALALVDFDTLGKLVISTDPWVMLSLPVLVVVQTAVGAWRFKTLFDPERRIGYREHLRQYFLAGYFNLLLPSSIGGDAVRVYLLHRHEVSKSTAAAYIFSERLLGLYCLVAIAMGGAIAISLADHIFDLILYVAIIAATGFGIIALIVRTTKNWHQYHVQAVRDSLLALWRQRGRLIAATAISFGYQFLTLSFTLVGAYAIDAAIDPTLILTLVPLVWLATFLPISLGGVGVREITFIGLFAEFGVGTAEALLLSITTYAAIVITGIIGGIWAALDAVRVQTD